VEGGIRSRCWRAHAKPSSYSPHADAASTVCAEEEEALLHASRRPVHPALRIKGPVIHGFGRGSKELGIPTANLDAAALAPELDRVETGVYYGWASVGSSPATYKMVMSIGW